MKNIFLLFLLSMLLVPGHVAYGAFDVPHVQVFGVAEKEVSPDEIRWNLAVRTEGATAREVSDKHITEVSDTLNLLYELGQNKDSVTTTNMQLKEHWVYTNNNRQKQGYFAITSIRFTSDDFTTYVAYWTRLAELNNVSVSGVSFAVSNRSEIEDDVKVLAIAEAKKKAQRFVKALDAELGSPLQIEELGDGNVFSQRPVRAALMESDGGGQPVSPGKQVIQAQVKVVFSLQ
ncbi:SIMPL domain-containing protein [Desulforhopalus sp. 52FAK]